jgi:hypothetical protein
MTRLSKSGVVHLARIADTLTSALTRMVAPAQPSLGPQGCTTRVVEAGVESSGDW